MKSIITVLLKASTKSSFLFFDFLTRKSACGRVLAFCMSVSKLLTADTKYAYPNPIMDKLKLCSAINIENRRMLH